METAESSDRQRTDKVPQPLKWETDAVQARHPRIAQSKWDFHREEILEIFDSESLSYVVQHMREKHGFIAKYGHGPKSQD